MRHREIHTKREEEKAMSQGDKVGDYHLLESPVFLAWKEAKPLLDTYYSREGDSGKGSCKLCAYTCSAAPQMRTHLLSKHLPLLSVFRCPECGEELGAEAEIRKHLQEEHQLDWEGLERVDDPEYESAETEVDASVEEIASLPLEDLVGRKISSAQGRALRKTRVTRNEAAGHYECELCDFKKELLSQLADHVMTVHYNVYTYR